MQVFEKYRRMRPLSRDGTTPLERSVLASFQLIVDGAAKPYFFEMISEEDARSVLDDDDFALWIKEKGKFCVLVQ